MQVKSIAECSKGSILQLLSTFIKLPFVIKIFVLSIFEWLFYTDFTLTNKNWMSLWRIDHLTLQNYAVMA